MGELFKKPAFIIIFFVALAGALIWSYIDKRGQEKEAANNQPVVETPTLVNLTNIDPVDFDSLIKDELALAANKAAEANSQNKLAAVEIELPNDLLPNTGRSRYIYTAPNDIDDNWLITISQASSNYIRALIPKTDYLGDLQTMNTALWKFNYITALQIAEKNGGLDFREKNELQEVKITLRHTPPKNWLLWTVEYQGKGVTFTKQIDANSGQVIEPETTE